MVYNRKNEGVCSASTEVTINEKGIIEDVVTVGGCDGNLKGIRELLKGMDAKKAAELMSGIDCRGRGTSCPDQIAITIKEALAKG